MKEFDEYYIPEIEWEYSDFPLKIINLEFEKNNWGFDKSSTITIWRNEKQELKGEIIGSISGFMENENESFVGEGNIIKGQIIKGYDNKGNIFKINESFLTIFQTNSYQKNNNGYLTKGTVIFDSLDIEFLEKKSIESNDIRYDWFICNKITPHFQRTTTRQLKPIQKKIRRNIDDYDNSIESLIRSSSSKDYCQIKTLDFKFIISKVPSKFLNGNTEGLCFEFRENINEIDSNLITGVKSFVSFLLGTEIHHIGYSITNDEKLKASHIKSLNRNISEIVMPPIKFNLKYEWGDFSFLVNQYLPKYLDLRESLSLDISLSKYWIAKNLPIGTNLPVLASALETIAGKYLKINNLNQSEYLSQEDFLELIKKEKLILEEKLKSVEGVQIMLNKILGAFRKGANEKMNIFFQSIGLNVGTSEKKAINLRNKMAHSSKDYNVNKNVFNDLVFSRIYETLFNRILLKLLGFEGYYIDYSIKGCRLKHIDEVSGKN